jgi:ligand-binding sensor domain-containing protein
VIPALVVAAAVGATAAPPPKELRFGHITVREGLSNSWVHAILKDQRGFMWFGTSGGLDRYDGSEFVHYEPRPGDATSLGSRAVMALVEDRQGRLWVGGANGLSLYDRALDRFTTYAVSAQGMDNDVRDVLEDDEGRVWVVTVAGRLHQFDPAAGSFRAFGEARGRTEWPCLFEDRTGHLWVGSAAGLDRCDRGRRACVSVAGLRGSEVTDVLQDADGTLWVGTLGAGLNRLDPETLGVERYLPDPKDPASIASRRVRKLGRDDDGRLYLGTENGGLDVFDPRAQTFVHHVFDREDPGSIGNNSVWAILFDDRGVLWTGTYGDGVSFATPQRQRFSHLKARRED